MDSKRARVQLNWAQVGINLFCLSMLLINATRVCVRAFEHVLGGTELLKWRALLPSGWGELFHDAQYTTHTHFASTSCKPSPHCFISTKVVHWVRSCAIYYIVLCCVCVCVCAPCVNGYANGRADKTRLLPPSLAAIIPAAGWEQRP